MEVRLSDVLSAHKGLVKDQHAIVLRVVLDEADQRKLDELDDQAPGYRRFAPERMATGIWVRFLEAKRLPLSTEITAAFAANPDDDRTAEQQDDDAVAGSMVFLELAGVDFKCDVNIGTEVVPMHVARWQFPLTHGKVRTAFSTHGWTLEGGVIADLRRAGGLQDDDWWLAIYVMLSRARKLKNLILIGFTEQVENLLRRGPPQHLAKITADLEKRAFETLERMAEGK